MTPLLLLALTLIADVPSPGGDLAQNCSCLYTLQSGSTGMGNLIVVDPVNGLPANGNRVCKQTVPQAARSVSCSLTIPATASSVAASGVASPVFSFTVILPAPTNLRTLP